MSSSQPAQKAILSRLWEISLVAVFLVSFVIVLLYSVRIAKGVAKEVATPEYVIRLQILNASSTAGVANRLAEKIGTYRDKEIEIKIVDLDNFNLTPVKESFIISREENNPGAPFLAERLKLDPDEIVYKPLVHNYKQISTTLVLGDDFAAVTMDSLSEE